METDIDTLQYIIDSKINIDNFIHRNEFKKAFGLFILFLERLDDTSKTVVIDYYSKQIPF